LDLGVVAQGPDDLGQKCVNLPTWCHPRKKTNFSN